MADFDPPFASVGGVNRTPTTNEQSDGFDCGSADLTLFNRMFGRIEAELKAIQDEGGIVGSEGDDTTVLQAILAIIAAATGEADTSGYVLFTQAQSRLPIFPEVTTNSGVIAVTSPAPGTVRVPASASILHRGIKPYTTSETDLSTTASKTYHLRWNPTDGFALKDLADTGTYNPTSAAETNTAFDSTYDNMLVSRVVTNSSNVATITNMVNKVTLVDMGLVTKSLSRTTSGATYAIQFDNISLNWARTPKATATIARTSLIGVMPMIPEDPKVLLDGSVSDATGTVNGIVNRYGVQIAGSMDVNSVSASLDLIFQASYTAISI